MSANRQRPNSRYLVPGALLLVGALGLAGALYSRSQRRPVEATTPPGEAPSAMGTPRATEPATPPTSAARPLLPPAESVSSIAEHGGWFGSVVVPGMVLAIAEVPADSAAARVYREQYPSGAGFVQVTAHNRTGVPVAIDVTHAELVRRDGSAVPTTDRNKVLGSATTRRDLVLARHDAPYLVAPHAKLDDGLIFVPPGLRLDDVTGVAVQVGTGRVVVPGHVFTAEQKRALFRAPSPVGEAGQRGAPSPAPGGETPRQP